MHENEVRQLAFAEEPNGNLPTYIRISRTRLLSTYVSLKATDNYIYSYEISLERQNKTHSQDMQGSKTTALIIGLRQAYCLGLPPRQRRISELNEFFCLSMR